MFNKKDNGDFIDYPENRGGSNGQISRISNVGNLMPIFLLGIFIAVYNNYARWKFSVINYFSNLFHHPRLLFHFENLVYIFVIVFMLKFTLGYFKRMIR